MFIDNYPGKTPSLQKIWGTSLIFIYHLSLNEYRYRGESWDQTGYPNSPAGDWGDQDSLPLTWEYFDIHNIRIRRLLAKNVMLVDEDLHWQATIPISGRMCWTVILGINNAFIYSYCIEVQIVDDVETLIWELYREHTHQLTSTTCDMMVGWILRWCILYVVE